MNVACPECRSVFRVDPARVPAGGVRARCSVCGAVMLVDAPTTFAEDAWSPPAPAAPASSAARRGTPQQQLPATSAAVAHEPWPPAPQTPTPTPGPTPRATPTPRYVSVAGSGMGTPAAPAAPVAPVSAVSTPAASQPLPPSAQPPLPPPLQPPLQPPASPPAGGPPAPASWRASLPGAVSSQGRVGAGEPPATGSGERAPINPFLANDPNQKAKRLARALVSDIVAYHPQQREQGLRDGTLRQLFKDEIKKSYEEYVEQVGMEFAESTGHFQDALNEILASGRKMF